MGRYGMTGRMGWLLMMIAAATVMTAAVKPAHAADAFTGYWRYDRQKNIFRVERDAGGVYRLTYGFDQAGEYGWGELRRRGERLEGTWSNRLGQRGDVHVYAYPPRKGRPGSGGMVFDFKSAIPRVAGKVYAGLVDRDPGKTPFKINEAEQAWRYGVIEKHAKLAAEQRMSLDDWARQCGQIRAEINRARKWPKGWPLPRAMRQIGWSDWEVGWVEIYFLEAMREVAQRDAKAPTAPVVYHRFPRATEAPMYGFTREVTSYSNQNNALSRLFTINKLHRRASVSGVRTVQAHYLLWDHITANESSGVIARLVQGDLRAGEKPRIALYNASHQPISGKYTIHASDGERKLAEGSGHVAIKPYGETLVDVDIRSPYAFFHWHIDLDFTPDGYVMQPIPKDRLKPFHEMGDAFAKISKRKDAEAEFMDGVRWARVKQAWDRNHLQQYARAVRLAAGNLYNGSERDPAMKAFLREHLALIEQPNTAAMPGLPTGETELALRHDTTHEMMATAVMQKSERLDPKVLANPKQAFSERDWASMQGRLQAVKRGKDENGDKGENGEPKTIKLKVSVEDGYFVLHTGHSVMLTGTITLYDGHVKIGTYALDGGWHHSSESKVRFASEHHVVTFYQDRPSYKVDVQLHQYIAPPPPGSGTGKMYYNFWQQLNRAIPGAVPDPRP